MPRGDAVWRGPCLFIPENRWWKMRPHRHTPLLDDLLPPRSTIRSRTSFDPLGDWSSTRQLGGPGQTWRQSWTEGQTWRQSESRIDARTDLLDPDGPALCPGLMRAKPCGCRQERERTPSTECVDLADLTQRAAGAAQVLELLGKELPQSKGAWFQV